MDDKTIVVTDENGNNTVYEIILTFDSPDTGKKYVIYKLPEEDEEVMAAVYEEQTDGEGVLTEIQSEEEFEMIQDILDSFIEEDDE
jgi:uncharacterized protein YrzB (UPF0473 family)